MYYLSSHSQGRCSRDTSIDINVTRIIRHHIKCNIYYHSL